MQHQLAPRLLPLLTLLSLLGGPARADDAWPFFRGVGYDGQAVNSQLVESWPAEGPPVLWVRQAGVGYSSLIAWKGRIATQWQTLAGQYVICMDADTGETVWQYRYAWPYLPGSVYPGPRATPTYWNERLYYADPDGLGGTDDHRWLCRFLLVVDLHSGMEGIVSPHDCVFWKTPS